MLIVKQKS